MDTPTAAKKTCNVPGCDREAKTRGLCGMHYWQSNNAADPDHRENISSYMNESTRVPAAKKAKKPKKAKPAARRKPTPRIAPPAAEPQRSPEDDGTRGVCRDEDPRATADTIMHVMGAQRIPIPSRDGNLYIIAETNKAMWVGPDGDIKVATIHAGENKELLIG